MLELSFYGLRRLIRDFLKWLPLLEAIRSFSVVPEPGVRVQMDGLNPVILGAGLQGRVGTGLAVVA
jgi:hypothetical protein